MIRFRLKIILCVGLPGSGKTTFLEKKFPYPQKYRLQNLDDDNLSWEEKQRFIKSKVSKFIEDAENYYLRDYEHEIGIDILTTTNNNLNEIINLISNIKPEYKNYLNFEIHYWKENRKLCLYNDRGRRNKNSEVSIRNLPLEYPEIYDKTVKYEVIEHEVRKGDNRKIFLGQYQSQEDNDKFILKSDSWSGGGSWGDYNGNSGSISSEIKPEFEQFEKMILELKPDISFVDYKKLYKETVTIEEVRENDYYGGREIRYWYECNLEKLFNLLVELNIVDNEEYKEN